MEARLFSFAAWCGLLLAVCAVSVQSVEAAGFRSENFTVSAPTPELAREIGLAAERLRKDLAIEWLGQEMPSWSKPCPISAQVSSDLGAGGATSFIFQNSEVYRWRMSIQGSRERILDSVLPHEITHTIFASHFRQPLPRWADEGACTTVEHESEKAKQKQMLLRFLKTGHGIAFSDLFAMKEYPADVMPLYSEGYSLARFLIDQGGKKKFLEFLGDGMRDENWPRAVREYYDAENLWALQNTWLDWVRDGSPSLDQAPRNRSYTQLAKASSSKNTRRSESDIIYRAQSADSAPYPKSPYNRAASSQGKQKLAALPVGRSVQESTNVYPRNVPLRSTASETMRSTPAPVSLETTPLNTVPIRTTPRKTAPAYRSRVLLEWNRSAETRPSERTSSSSTVYDSRAYHGTVLR